MIKSITLSMSILLILLGCVLAVGQEVTLTPDATPEGWSQSGDVREFEGAALYRHINGGSEMYLEHGFQTLFVQDFMNAEDEEIRLEIYVIDSPEGADAIMAENTRGLETTEEFGRISSIDPYQILFLQGPYYISITCYSESEAVADGMKAIATAIESHLSE